MGYSGSRCCTHNFGTAGCRNNGPSEHCHGTRIYPLQVATGRVILQSMANYFTHKNSKTVRMDNAKHFKNTRILGFLEGIGAQAIFSIPYKPETNGVAERAVRSAKDYIRANSQKHWDSPEELMKMNEYLSLPKLIQMVQSSGISPFQVGQEVWVNSGRKVQGEGIRHPNKGKDIIIAVGQLYNVKEHRCSTSLSETKHTG